MTDYICFDIRDSVNVNQLKNSISGCKVYYLQPAQNLPEKVFFSRVSDYF